MTKIIYSQSGAIVTTRCSLEAVTLFILFCYIVCTCKTPSLRIASSLSLYFFHRSILAAHANRNLKTLPCVVLRTGLEGVCMFAIHCLKANGTHLGTCRDGYYFKSCCQLNVCPASSLIMYL